MGSISKQCGFALVVIGFLALPSAGLRAEMIIYTETIVASGTLGSSSFSNALVTVTFNGDTANVGSTDFPVLGPYYSNPVGTATVAVAGVGTATVTEQLYVTDIQNSDAAGFKDGNGNGVIFTTNVAFGTYTLTTAIGPISGSFSGILPGFSTSMGNLAVTSDSGTSTFQAIIPSAVPEPASMLLMGFGIVGVAASAARRARTLRSAP